MRTWGPDTHMLIISYSLNPLYSLGIPPEKRSLLAKKPPGARASWLRYCTSMVPKADEISL